MWSVFDYASISTAAAPDRPFITVDATPQETNNQHVVSKSPQRHNFPEQSSSRASNDDFAKDVPNNDIAQSGDELPSGTDSTLFDPEAFSDLPEEWILDDWTLFGAPLSAYHAGFD